MDMHVNQTGKNIQPFSVNDFTSASRHLATCENAGLIEQDLLFLKLSFIQDSSVSDQGLHCLPPTYKKRQPSLIGKCCLVHMGWIK